MTETIAVTAVSAPGADERFIPLRYRALAERLLADAADGRGGILDPGPVDRDALRETADLIGDVIRQEADGLRDALLEHYEGFNPDRDRPANAPPADPKSANRPPVPEPPRRLLADIGYLFDRVGFRPVPWKLFHHAMRSSNIGGVDLKVRLDLLDHLMMFRRGAAVTDMKTPGFMNLYESTVRVPVARRLGVVLKLKNDPHLLLKMFKDVPLTDLETVLPGTRVRMRWPDKVSLVSTAATALYTVGKLMFDANPLNIDERILQGLAIAAAGGAWRIYSSYVVLRNKAEGRLNRQLYYQQLDGNLGLLDHLLESVVQQEANAVFAGYVFALAAVPRPQTLRELENSIAKYLQQACGDAIGYEAGEAAVGLTRLRLWRGGDRPEVVPPAEAIPLLREHVLTRRTRRHHVDRTDGLDGWIDLIHACG
jgi:hypothetical protein